MKNESKVYKQTNRSKRIRFELESIDKEIERQLSPFRQMVISSYDWFPWAAAPITPQNYQWRGKSKLKCKMSESGSIQFALVRTPECWESAHDVIPFLPPVPDRVSLRSLAFCVGFEALGPAPRKGRLTREYLKITSCSIFYSEDCGNINEHVVSDISVPLSDTDIDILEHRWTQSKVSLRYVKKKLDEQGVLIDKIGRRFAETLTEKAYTGFVVLNESLPFDDVLDQDVWKFYTVYQDPNYASKLAQALEDKSSYWNAISSRKHFSYINSVPLTKVNYRNNIIIGPDISVVACQGNKVALLDEGEWVLIESLGPRLSMLCDGLLVPPTPAELVPDMLIQSALRSARVRFAMSDEGQLASAERAIASQNCWIEPVGEMRRQLEALSSG